MTELEVCGGIVLAGTAIGGTLAPGVVAMHKRLEAELGDMPRWADVAALVGGVGAAVVVATACGAVLGWRSDALAHDPYIGAVWGFVGGITGPSLWPSVRGLVVEAVRARVGAKSDGASE